MARPRLFWILPFALALTIAGSVAMAPPTRADGEGTDEDPPKEKPAEDEVDPTLYALGGISAADLWTSYMLVGAVADHFSKGGYDADQVKGVIDVRITFDTKASEVLEKVAAQPNLAEGEKKHIEGVRACYQALSAYAQALLTYSRDQSKANAGAFQAKRTAAWTLVKDVLGIK